MGENAGNRTFSLGESMVDATSVPELDGTMLDAARVGEGSASDSLSYASPLLL